MKTSEHNAINESSRENLNKAWIDIIHSLQDQICSALEKEDGKAKFREDIWERPEGGGGKTRVISNGNVFEKGGVNTSVVYGSVTDVMRNQLKIDQNLRKEFIGKPLKWFACGLSIVIHPLNPFIPTIHCNYRMFELSAETDGKEITVDRWFGGGESGERSCVSCGPRRRR